MNRNGMGPRNDGLLTGRGMGYRHGSEHRCVPGSGRGPGNRRGHGDGKGRGMGGFRNGGGNQSETALILRIEALEAEIRTLKEKSL